MKEELRGAAQVEMLEEEIANGERRRVGASKRCFQEACWRNGETDRGRQFYNPGPSE